MSRSRDKGTKAETKIVEYLRANGWPAVERRAMRGGNDCGDIAGLPGVAVEAKDCVRLEPAAWIAEANREAANAGEPVGVTWFHVRGKGSPANWGVLMDGETFLVILRAIERGRGVDHRDPFDLIPEVPA